MKTKLSKNAKIAQLQREVMEALAGQIHTYHAADAGLDKASLKHLAASGVVITLTVLGGRELIPPTVLRDGLSGELITALRGDLRRSYALAAMFKPRDPP